MKMTRQASFRLFLFSAVAGLFQPSMLHAATFSSTVLADGPVAYYQLEETSGPSALDSTANHFDAIYAQDVDTNGVTFWPTLGIPGIDTNSILFRYYVDSIAAPHHGFVDIPFKPELSQRLDPAFGREWGAVLSVSGHRTQFRLKRNVHKSVMRGRD